MVFKVHVSLAKAALSEMVEKNVKVRRKAFILGNVFPDFILPHIPRHRKIHSSRFFDKQHAKICARRRKDASKIHVWDSFLLGILSHYAADYSCAAHREGYNEKMRAHMRHEKAQLAALMANPDILRSSNSQLLPTTDRMSSQIGNGKASNPIVELIDAMDAIRLTYSGLLKA